LRYEDGIKYEIEDVKVFLIGMARLINTVIATILTG
jgi:hypothetical protein